MKKQTFEFLTATDGFCRPTKLELELSLENNSNLVFELDNYTLYPKEYDDPEYWRHNDTSIYSISLDKDNKKELQNFITFLQSLL